ncbi:right-handed parallel beta-helix repeat-containing protein [Luteolibacter yonseiensis]|uniref:Right-handed parallel beta-helix repeat-containing protein n=1 Tax=Luteolibacter yonseiensis TaxID=1144680 RepID=A0A934R1T0_9BACT|nr:right-handed parallel beta-helix repeat-containing protein [Luteolibacter yonseiensis]MBK1816813.1 right-handed parallel beta-helix repeat-containing protein [Luteolibacter yonseiensis]
MTLNEARKILGLGEKDDPGPALEKLSVARGQLAKMVDTAPNNGLAERYQAELDDFDKALTLVREHLDAAGLLPPPLPPEVLRQQKTVVPPPAKTVVLANAPSPPKVAGTIVALEAPHAPSGSPPRRRPYVIWSLVLLVAAGGGVGFHLQNKQVREKQRLARIEELDRKGTSLIENRRWQEAADAFAEIEKISPHSETARRGRLGIEEGMGEEQTQFIGYWTGQATAELEAGRFDEAASAARQVLAKYPDEAEASAILRKIDDARAGQVRSAAIAAARQALDERKWDGAVASANTILSTSPEDPDAKSILADALAGKQKAAADEAKALELLKLATARDNGQFDQQALDWLREAVSLAPGNVEIATRLEKLSSYIRTLRVPEDFATPDEAIAAAHDRDRIVLGASIWKGPLVVNAAIELQGAGFNDAIIECRPEDGSAITIGPGAKGARISGITFRHETFAVGTDRFSAALVRGGNAAFVDCRFTGASGHGLAVIEGGQANVSRSRFADNGWNGAAASGNGSSLEVRDCESLDNFEHGIETWDGAAATLVNNRCQGNSRNGIHTDNRNAAANIQGNQLIENREFGIVIDSAGSGKITGNTARANLLGGIVVRNAAGQLAVSENQATLNQGPGLVLEKDLQPSDYAKNSVTQNVGEQVIAGVDLSEKAENASEASPPPPPAQPAGEQEIPRAKAVIEE